MKIVSFKSRITRIFFIFIPQKSAKHQEQEQKLKSEYYTCNL